jgi:hypothetical protein
MAVQNQSSNALEGNQDQMYDQVVRHTILNTFDEGTNTELTPEQNKYLAGHQDGLKYKAGIMLYNLQNFLNYLIKEYNNYYPNNENQENPTQRNSQETKDDKDKYTTDAKKMVKYLSNDNNGPKIKGMKNIKCTYTNLRDAVNNTTSTDNIYNMSNVFVQIKDPDGYIRYLKLISINGTNIHLKSKAGSGDINVNKTTFEQLYVWHEDGRYINPDLKFNILVSPPDYHYTDYILRQIWDKQNKDLGVKEGRISTGVAISVVGLGTGGISVATAGAYRLCDSCTGDVAKKIEEALPPDHEMDENSPLLKNNGVKDKCLAYCHHPRCSKCGVSTTILILGLFVFIGSAITLYYINQLKPKYEEEHKNLYNYEPPLNNIGD